MKLTSGYFNIMGEKYKYWKLGDCFKERIIGDSTCIDDFEHFFDLYEYLGVKYVVSNVDFYYYITDDCHGIGKEEIKKILFINKFNKSFEDKLNE